MPTYINVPAQVGRTVKFFTFWKTNDHFTFAGRQATYECTQLGTRPVRVSGYDHSSVYHAAREQAAYCAPRF